ncbi:peroxisomal coenzyme A diphosphatase NUDT7 [Ambystoma mexicanum]|uniref:peroxisomal coenzyme A diphosphatase NUDT7 n=1 Tax=Ambystoma mexicanum TaxID=8296 RepID=UPI0037E891EE
MTPHSQRSAFNRPENIFCSQEEVMSEDGDQFEQHSIQEKAKKILRKYDVEDKFSHLAFSKASVLLPLLMKDGKLHLLFTVRSMKLKTSPGDVCFPGGRGEPTDCNEIETALREAEEEVGLHPGQVEFISRLVPAFSKDGTLVTPVVAIIQETFQARPNPEEVTDVFLVPLEYFVKPGKYFTVPIKNKELTKVLHCFEYKDPKTNKVFMIWGLTAHFALMLAVLLLEKKPSFNDNFDVDHQISSIEQMLLGLNKSKL